MEPIAIRAVARKELLRIRRDPRTLGFMIIFPIFMLVLYGFGIRYDVHSVSMAVLDMDQSPSSRGYVERFFSTGYFVRTADVSSYGQLTSLLDAGRVRLGLVVPQGFGRRLALSERVTVQALLDGTDNNTASIALGYFNAISRGYSVEVILDRLRRIRYPPPFQIPALEAEGRVWYNPGLQSAHFVVPGLIAIIMLQVGAMMTAITIVQEKESGSVEQLIVSPIRPSELVIGKILPYVLFAMVDMLLVIAVAYLVFGLPVRGSLLLLLCMALLYLTNVLGLGVVVSTMTKTVQSAMLLAFLLTLLPSILLSGFVFPLENMPAVLRAMSLAVPARYFLEIIRGIYLKGTGLGAFWPQALFLAGFGSAMLLISTLRLKKRLE
ncbi:MAG: ABC transporter permease [Acidobacteria bacterium]|nr:ABC transporter permease [Acidobacteriota bacterium]